MVNDEKKEWVYRSGGSKKNKSDVRRYDIRKARAAESDPEEDGLSEDESKPTHLAL